MRALALAFLMIQLATPAEASWRIYLVDSSSENVGTAVALWQGTPSIAYYNSSGLNLARWENDAWRTEVVDPRTSTHNRGPSLIFDDQGQPHIGFYCGTPWHAYRAGGSWITEPIDTEAAGDYLSLCLDSEGRLHAAYNKPVGLFSSMLKYAWKDDMGWHAESADPVGGYDCVLGFDALGQPLVVHCQSWSGGALYCSVRTPTGWVHDTILAGSASQSFLTLGPQGDPHVSYYWTQGGSYDLRYADRIGETWRFDVVDHGEQQSKRGWDNCMARAPDGSYHISYHAHNEMQLRYAHGDYGHWDVEVVDAVGMWNLFSSIAVDGAGRASIAYCDEDEGGALYLATQADLSAVPDETAAEWGGIGLELWPNPFDAATSITFVTPDTSPVQLGIFDARGKCLRTLASGAQGEGVHSILWDGREEDGRRVSAGVYFCRLATREGTATRKLVVLPSGPEQP